MRDAIRSAQGNSIRGHPMRSEAIRSNFEAC